MCFLGMPHQHHSTKDDGTAWESMERATLGQMEGPEGRLSQVLGVLMVSGPVCRDMPLAPVLGMLGLRTQRTYLKYTSVGRQSKLSVIGKT